MSFLNIAPEYHNLFKDIIKFVSVLIISLLVFFTSFGINETNGKVIFGVILSVFLGLLYYHLVVEQVIKLYYLHEQSELNSNK